MVSVCETWFHDLVSRVVSVCETLCEGERALFSMF